MERPTCLHSKIVGWETRRLAPRSAFVHENDRLTLGDTIEKNSWQQQMRGHDCRVGGGLSFDTTCTAVRFATFSHWSCGVVVNIVTKTVVITSERMASAFRHSVTAMMLMMQLSLFVRLFTRVRAVFISDFRC